MKKLQAFTPTPSFNKTSFTNSRIPKNLVSGFTLIELLVVIGIIGVLAAVIMGSLNSSRATSVDAAIKSSLVNARTQAQIYNDKYLGYGTATSACLPTTGTLFADVTIAAEIKQIDDQNGATPKSISCVATPGSFAIASVLKTNSAKAYCIDANNTGKVVAVTAGDASTAFVGTNCK